TSCNADEPVSLTWTATNAHVVTITAESASGTRQLPTTTSPLPDQPKEDTTYTITATGPTAPPAKMQIRIQVVQPLPPQITSFTANPTLLLAGQTTTLDWKTTNVDNVTITPSVLGDDVQALGPSGPQTGVVVQQTTTFTINASGPGGNATPQSLAVSVEPFNMTFSGSPSTVTSGQAVALNWAFTGDTSKVSSLA